MRKSKRTYRPLLITGALVAIGAILVGFKKATIEVGDLGYYDPDKFSEFYTTEDLQRSTTATQQGINNTAPDHVKTQAAIFAQNVLDLLTIYFGQKLIINSWFRSQQLNTAVGGSATSDHLTGTAADIESPTGDNTDIITALVDWNIPFDQMIIYDSLSNPSRIHLSYDQSRLASDQRREVLLKAGGNYTQISYGSLAKQYA
jgi:hypothetical protein